MQYLWRIINYLYILKLVPKAGGRANANATENAAHRKQVLFTFLFMVYHLNWKIKHYILDSHEDYKHKHFKKMLGLICQLNLKCV